MKTRHHRVQRCRGGSNNDDNISLVTKTKHRAYHTLFKNMTVHQIANELSEVWIDPQYEIIVQKKVPKLAW